MKIFNPYVLLLLLASSLLSNEEMTPEAALQKLMNGNARYVGDALEHPRQDQARREALTARQAPFAIIVGCSDSRVPPEITFDQGLGDLFVVRVAGNVIGPVELDSIEYAALYLKASVILVLGHENCGAVTAVINGNTQEIEDVAELIEPSAQQARLSHPDHPLETAIKNNALRMRDYVIHSSAVRRIIKQNKIGVHAAYYDLSSGRVELLGNGTTESEKGTATPSDPQSH
jgi:carbonic anhydrase